MCFHSLEGWTPIDKKVLIHAKVYAEFYFVKFDFLSNFGLIYLHQIIQRKRFDCSLKASEKGNFFLESYIMKLKFLTPFLMILQSPRIFDNFAWKFFKIYIFVHRKTFFRLFCNLSLRCDFCNSKFWVYWLFNEESFRRMQLRGYCDNLKE